MKNYKIIIVVVLLLIFGGVGYYFISKLDSNTSISKAKASALKYDGNVTTINLDNMTYEGTGLSIENNTVYIVYGGTYELTGTTKNNVIVDVEDDNDVTLILNGVSITNDYPINILQGDVTIILNDGSKNYLEYTKVYDENEEVEAAIYSKDDLVIEGNGTLEIKSTNNGIVSKDTLTINNGTFIINADNNGIKGKDSVTINGGNFTINSGNDAIKSTNDTDSTLGYIEINGGTFNITASGDGIQAETNITIKNGEFTIKTGNGYTQTSKTNDFGMWNNTTKNSNDESIKGIKAGNMITISGGIFDLNTEDDGIHSNGDLVITGGKFTIKSTDDGLHADGLVQIDGGTFDITSSEGIEGTYVKINDGTINISAFDDGINAGNKSNKYSALIEINGGDITINMGSGDTDGVDSNGNIIINGGTINVTGQSTFDYDGTGTINGGIVICNGEKVSTLPNQFIGGGMQGGMNQGNMGRNMGQNEQFNGMQPGGDMSQNRQGRR